MKTPAELFHNVRSLFPELTQKADRQYIKHWGEPPVAEVDAYIWFESVANALNHEMQREAYLQESKQFFRYIANIFPSASEEVKNCIDVSFVENLFWGVSSSKSEPYWQGLPQILKALYVGFHGFAPTR